MENAIRKMLLSNEYRCMSIVRKHRSIFQKQLNRLNNNVNLDECIINGHKRESERLDLKCNKRWFPH